MNVATTLWWLEGWSCFRALKQGNHSRHNMSGYEVSGVDSVKRNEVGSAQAPISASQSGA